MRLSERLKDCKLVWNGQITKIGVIAITPELIAEIEELEDHCLTGEDAMRHLTKLHDKYAELIKTADNLESGWETCRKSYSKLLAQKLKIEEESKYLQCFNCACKGNPCCHRGGRCA